MKILSVGAEVIHADKRMDGRTYMTKVKGAFMAMGRRLKINTVNLWFKICN
jgi:hypothetical protein